MPKMKGVGDEEVQPKSGFNVLRTKIGIEITNLEKSPKNNSGMSRKKTSEHSGGSGGHAKNLISQAAGQTDNEELLEEDEGQEDGTAGATNNTGKSGSGSGPINGKKTSQPFLDPGRQASKRKSRSSNSNSSQSVGDSRHSSASSGR